MAATVTQVTPPPRSRVSALTAIAFALVGAALTALVWGLGAPTGLTVDGAAHTVAPGTTVADLAGAHYTRARPGILYKIDGGIANVVGGDPTGYLRNGRPVADTQPVYPGDVIVSVQGASYTERVISERVSIDPTATIQGDGPILTVVQQGKPGVALVSKGAVSGDVVTSTVLAPAVNIVLQASYPTSANRVVALTFDDGPWPDSTLKIAQILKAAGVHGTFFELGEQVRKWPQLTAAVAADGNVIGNHSWSHPFFTKMKPAAIRKQITDTAKAIKAVTGKEPTLLRPPYGAINTSVWAQAKATHESIALWNVDTLDWTRPGVPKIMKTFAKEMGRSSVVLMHDGGGDRSQSVAALPKVIAWLKARGYLFLTVDQMQARR